MPKARALAFGVNGAGQVDFSSSYRTIWPDRSFSPWAFAGGFRALKATKRAVFLFFFFFFFFFYRENPRFFFDRELHEDAF